jgi:hypothetical protein
LLDFDPIVILRATSILGGQKEDNEMICSIPRNVMGTTKPAQQTEGCSSHAIKDKCKIV